MTLCDTGPLIALLDADDVHHFHCLAVLSRLSPPLVTTWPCFTEAMHFLGKARGWEAQSALWNLVRREALRVECLSADNNERLQRLMEDYRDSPMDIADASLVALAEILGLVQIFTLDSHFLAYRMADKKSFVVVP